MMGRPAQHNAGIFDALSLSWDQLPASLRAKITWTPMALEQALLRLVEEPLTETLALEIGDEVHHQLDVVMTGLQEFGGFLELVVSLARRVPHEDEGRSLGSRLLRLDVLSEMRIRWLDGALRSLVSLPMRWLFFEVSDTYEERETGESSEPLMPPPYGVTALACRLSAELTLTRHKPVSRVHDLCEMASSMAARWMMTARDFAAHLRDEAPEAPELEYFEAIWNQASPYYESYGILEETLTLVKNRERHKAIDLLGEHLRGASHDALLQALQDRLQNAYVLPVYRGRTPSGLTSKRIDELVSQVDVARGTWLALTPEGVLAQGHTLKDVHERSADSATRPLLIQLRTS